MGKLIYADALMKAIQSLKVEKESPQMIWSGDVEAIIKDAQPALVRCKDCMYYMTIYCPCDGCCISQDWYCADGKRREADEQKKAR